MYALGHVTSIYLWRGDDEQVESLAGELIPRAQEKGAIDWRGGGMMNQGCLFALTSNLELLKAKAIEMLSAGLTVQALLGQPRGGRGFGRIWVRPAPSLRSSMKRGASLATR